MSLTKYNKLPIGFGRTGHLNCFQTFLKKFIYIATIQSIWAPYLSIRSKIQKKSVDSPPHVPSIYVSTQNVQNEMFSWPIFNAHAVNFMGPQVDNDSAPQAGNAQDLADRYACVRPSL